MWASLHAAFFSSVLWRRSLKYLRSFACNIALVFNTFVHISAMTYSNWVRSLVADYPELKGLSLFLQRTEYSSSTIISFEFSENSAPTKYENLSRDDLNRHLRSGATELYVIENLDPGVTELLGNVLEVDPQVFADHLDDSPWYRIGDIERHLPTLPSNQRNVSHLRLQFVAAIEMRPSDENTEIVVTDRDSIYSDLSKINVERIAGGLNPLPQEGMKFFPAILTRSHATAWFDSRFSKISGSKGE
jgi:hypothetical protein